MTENVVSEDVAVVISKIAFLVKSPTFQALVPVILSTFVKLETNPAGAAILGAQFLAEVLPLINANGGDVLTPLVNLFATMLEIKQPVEPAPAEPVPVVGTISTTTGAATVTVA